jgi:serine/threonine protein phosphatase PrpC
VQENDTFILCSDGLHGLVKADEMLKVAKMPLEAAANEFVKLALDRGAPDNVTVIVARVVRDASDDTLTDASGRELFDETVKETSALRATQ